jgi:tRNA U34 5-methylaminomethyl-2-thiouridine-forming methyltransferase MnmC
MTQIALLDILIALAHVAPRSGVGRMTGNDQSDVLDWRDGVPVSLRFDDPYFSLNNGLAETGHVFHAGNGLPERLCDGFRIAELGFGTGLNLLATARLWAGPGVLSFTSFEAFPMEAVDMAKSLAHFPDVAAYAVPLLEQWAKGARVIHLPGIRAEVIEGDARQTLPLWQGKADAWFLDGFSPAKNPELWSPEIMSEVARHTAPGGTFATYTAAGHVRRALQDAGFVVERRPGHGHKRHMTAGYLPQ